MPPMAFFSPVCCRDLLQASSSVTDFWVLEVQKWPKKGKIASDLGFQGKFWVKRIDVFIYIIGSFLGILEGFLELGSTPAQVPAGGTSIGWSATSLFPAHPNSPACDLDPGGGGR